MKKYPLVKKKVLILFLVFYALKPKKLNNSHTPHTNSPRNFMKKKSFFIDYFIKNN
jgi:hypothetical protein